MRREGCEWASWGLRVGRVGTELWTLACNVMLELVKRIDLFDINRQTIGWQSRASHKSSGRYDGLIAHLINSAPATFRAPFSLCATSSKWLNELK